MQDSLKKRLKHLESKLPAPEDRQEQANRAFLGSLTIEELTALCDIAERKERGIEPTAEERVWADALIEKYTLGKHDKYFAEIESHERP